METRMDAKKYVYAAVGAPLALAKAAQSRIERIRGDLGDRGRSSWEDLQRQIAEWADEGEKLVERLTDGKAIDDLASKVDFDQMQGQVTKLRDQLEDMLETWRANFRPQKPEGQMAEATEASTGTPVESTAEKPAETGKPAKSGAAKGSSTRTRSTTTSAKKPATKKTTSTPAGKAKAS